MSDNTSTADPPLVNGTAPAGAAGAPPAGECQDCTTNGERALAVLAGLIGVFVIGMAIDMFTGGALSRVLGAARGEVAPDD
jgi:hypothetical protein